MTNDELMKRATSGTEAVFTGLRTIADIGRTQPVPCEMFSVVRRELVQVMAAITELERRAHGGAAPAEGGLPDPNEPRNQV